MQTPEPTSVGLGSLLQLWLAFAGLSDGRSSRLRPGAALPRQTAQDAKQRYAKLLPSQNLRRTRRAATSTPASKATAECSTMKPVGKPDAGNPHVRFDERGRETERLPKAQATAPFLDSTGAAIRCARGLNSRNEWKAVVDPIRHNRKIAAKAKSQVDKPCGRDMAKTKGGTKFTILPLTPDLWPALDDLFGKSGASNGCWCMYWRLGGAYRETPRGANREALRQIVRRGSPTGLLAFDGDLPVGWCPLTPRDG